MLCSDERISCIGFCLERLSKFANMPWCRATIADEHNVGNIIIRFVNQTTQPLATQVYSSGGAQYPRRSARRAYPSQGGSPVRPHGRHPWNHCVKSPNTMDKPWRARLTTLNAERQAQRDKGEGNYNAQAVATGLPDESPTEAESDHQAIVSLLHFFAALDASVNDSSQVLYNYRLGKYSIFTRQWPQPHVHHGEATANQPCLTQ